MSAAVASRGVLDRSPLWTGFALAWRSMRLNLVRVLVFSVLIGGLSGASVEIDGRRTATLFATGLFLLLQVDAARRARDRIGAQHAFVMQQWPARAEGPWRRFLVGQAGFFVLQALASYVAIVSFHLSAPGSLRALTVALAVVELATLLAAAVHLGAPLPERDSVLQAAAFAAACVTIALLVALKTLLLYLDLFWLGAASSVLFIAGAIHVAARPPGLRINHPAAGNAPEPPREPTDATMTSSSIAVRGISKSYGTVRALDEASFVIPARGVHGLLGPNGAGKSTLLRVIVGLIPADAGEVRMARGAGGSSGEPRVAYQPEVPALYDYLTVGEFLNLALALRGEDAGGLETLAGRYELVPQWDKLIRTVSEGTRRKIAIVAAMAQKPGVLILDEPTNGLDTPAVIRLKEDVRRLGREGTTVLLSTHILDFAVGICDSVTLLKAGRVVFSGAVEELSPNRDPSAFETRVAALLGIPTHG